MNLALLRWPPSKVGDRRVSSPYFHALNSHPLAHEKKNHAARSRSLISATCAGLFSLALGLLALQNIGGVYERPTLGILVLLVTFPISCVCTLVAPIKVGPRRSQLAWLSLSSYVAVPILLVAIGKICDLLGRAVR